MGNQRVLHVSTECYPIAKAGGMADVVGSLPHYLLKEGWTPSVITPKYDLSWYSGRSFTKVYQGSFLLEGNSIEFDIEKYDGDDLGFEYYCVNSPDLYFRDSIYLNEWGHGFEDEAERNISFQRCTLEWLKSLTSKGQFNLVHCHDHQVAFIPFMMKKVENYEALADIPTIYTIHNGAYNSRYSWARIDLLPSFPPRYRQFLDWDGNIDGSAAAMRFADYVSTVSPTYLRELMDVMPSLNFMMEQEPDKFAGILNGIDNETWDPAKDELLTHKLTGTVEKFKKENKAEILSGLYHLNGIPLISFIGRFAHQKGADLLVPSIERILGRFGFVNFFLLGSGDPYVERSVQELTEKFPERVAAHIGYDEALAHKIYAASDFLVMPSRFEPCGLNQMFAMRYGSLVIAKKTGGLSDTVKDFEDKGAGVTFDYDSVDDLTHALARSLHLYKDDKKFKTFRKQVMKRDYSWSKSAKMYADIYHQLTN